MQGTCTMDPWLGIRIPQAAGQQLSPRDATSVPMHRKTQGSQINKVFSDAYDMTNIVLDADGQRRPGLEGYHLVEETELI